MAAHVIQQVRDALVAQLIAAGVASGRVYLYTNRPLDPSRVPYVFVRTHSDVDDRESIGFPALESIDVTFEITIVVYQTGDHEATALDLRRDVEMALFSSPLAATLGGKVLMLTRTNAEPDEDELVGAKPTYLIKLEVHAVIRHLESQPDVLQ